MAFAVTIDDQRGPCMEVPSVMRTRFSYCRLAVWTFGLWTTSAAALVGQTVQAIPLEVATRESATVDAAGQVMEEIMAIPIKSIPQSLLAEARGIAIVPGLIKGGFIVGVRHGRGVLVVRDEKGAWRAPAFITITGGSVGWQIGVQATDVILVFVTNSSIRGLMRGTFTIGADAAAAAGPVGREASAATDTRLRAEVYSYSRSRGLFAGVSLDGSALQIDAESTARYYRDAAPVATATPPGQPQPLPPSALRLYQTIARYVPTQPTDAAPAANKAGNAGDDEQALRTRLADSARRLNAILDESWKRYLALPAELSTSDRRPSAEAVNSTLARFAAVTNNATYRNLAQRPEFQETHDLLKRLAARPAPRPTLALPPPPR
jgi:SH3 domain-containing YSC84-like protein 1